jgi:hypothetical protein
MWPFSRKARDINRLPSVADELSPWTVAKAQYDGSPLIIRYSRVAIDWMGHPDLPIKLGFAISLNSPNHGGLPDPAENQELNEIEDIILREVDAITSGIHALVLTTGIMKEFVFYIPRDVDIKKIHKSIQDAVTTHDVHCIAVNEPTWDSFKSFTPE